MNNIEFDSFINQKIIAVIDGATGTNLMRMGLPSGKTSEHWVLENPKAIEDLHLAFIASGADLILTSTFGASRIRLGQSDLSDHFEEINRKAVEIARQVVQGSDVLVAASIGPLGQMLKPIGLLDEKDAEEAFREQAYILAESGADLIVIETQFDLKEASAAVRGAMSVGDIAIVCSFSFDRGTRTMMGVRPKDTAQFFNNSGVCALGINCGKSLEDNFSALVEMAHNTQLPIWFKPNAGLPKINSLGAAEYNIDPQTMASCVGSWIEAGARLIGGCCGALVDHTKGIADQVHAHIK